MSGHLNIVRKLLEQAGESAPDYINEDYTSDCFFDCLRKNTSSPLHTAINRKYWDIAWLLLDYGAEVDNRGFWQQTPLHVACRSQNFDAAKNLIQKYNADLTLRDDQGQYAIHTACIIQNLDFFKNMVSLGYFTQDHLSLTDNYGNTPLHTAAYHDNVVLIPVLIEMGANTEVTNIIGETPIQTAKPAARKVLEDLILKK